MVHDDRLGITSQEAIRIAQLALGTQLWVHRRVETVEYLGTRTVRRSISLDFTVPEPAGVEDVLHLPVAQFAKRSLTRFDLRDEAGQPIPMLTTQENGTLSVAMLRALARVPAPELVDVIVDRYVEQLVFTTSSRERTTALEKIFQPGTTIGRVLWEWLPFRALSLELSRNFLLYLPTPSADAGNRKIVKLAFDSREQAPRPRRITQRLGWSAVQDDFEVPNPAAAESYHVEVVAPVDMSISRGAFLARRNGEPVTHEVDHPVTRVHMNLANLDRSLAVVRVGMRVDSPILAGATALALLSTASLIFVRLRIAQFASKDSFDAVVAALLAIPGIGVAYIARPTEHPVVTAFLSGVRQLAVLCAALSFVGAIVLFAGYSLDQLKRIYVVLALGSLICSVGLFISWLAQRRQT